MIICGDCREMMDGMPEGYFDAIVTDLSAGIAAEHLVCAELILSGLRAFMCPPNCPYDVAVEMGKKIIRIQVKSTRHPRKIPQRKSHHSAYLFHTRRAGKGGKRRYKDGDFDVLALVALDIKRIAYIPASSIKDTIFIRIPGIAYQTKNNSGKSFDSLSLWQAIRCL